MGEDEVESDSHGSLGLRARARFQAGEDQPNRHCRGAEDGKQQAMVFRVDKNSIRSTLAGLEARTGLKVQYQDEQARKARNQ